MQSPNFGSLQSGHLRVSSDTASHGVALVYMPWGEATRASLALGILKQCARRIGVTADVHYLNIKFAEQIGLQFYQDVSVGEPLVPEWFFSYALFGPGGLGVLSNSWDDLMSSKYSPMIKTSMSKSGCTESKCRQLTTEAIPRYIDDCLASIDWSRYQLVGFSTTFAQTLASLLLSKRIKDRYPSVRIVFGGANAESHIGLELMESFSWIDYVVHGEAENSFPSLIQNVLYERYFDSIPGVSMRRGSQVMRAADISVALKDLNQSPMPDYSDYMKEVERLGINKLFRISLPFESARGCWWGAKAHCTFCGLNGATMAFRQKDPDRVYDDIMSISGQYRSLTLDAVDNILDMNYLETLLPRLAGADLDLSLFYEIKASMNKDQVRRLAAAGINRIQPGIESLNTEILRLMRKGTTASQNLQLLKWCLEFGIDVGWNILYGFPGEKPDQYLETPRIMRLIMHLQPPSSVGAVVFERFSPYHFQPQKFNLTLKPLGYYRLIYPDTVDFENIAYYFEGDWADRTCPPEEYISPARAVFREWTDAWEEKKVFFEYEKGPGFLTLFDNRPLQSPADWSTRRIKLNPIQSSIYLLCDQTQSFVTVQKKLTDIYKMPPTPQQTASMLDQFVEKGLMFREADRYLSLAVRRRRQQFKDRSPLEN